MKEINEVNKNNKFRIILEIILYIVAVVIIVMTFNGTGEIESAAYRMSTLRSVDGKSVAEAYYQYYGSFLYGLATVIKAFGIALGIVVAYIGSKINKNRS